MSIIPKCPTCWGECKPGKCEAKQQPEALRLADALRALHEAKKYHPSGPGGQMCGSEQYRLVTSGFAFEDLQNAAAELRRLHAENEALRAQNKEFRDVLAAACDSLGAFVSDHGWSDLDMQIFDNVCAALARASEAIGEVK